MIVLKPVAFEEPHVSTEAPRLAAITDTRLTLFANGKLMADVFLEELAAVLLRRFDFEALYAVKPDMSRVSPRPLLDQLAAQSHGIITGVGD